MLRIYLLGVATILLIVAARTATTRTQAQRYHARAMGRVVSWLEFPDSELPWSAYYYMQIAFLDHEGVQHVFTSRIGYARPNRVPGSACPVSYDIREPDLAVEVSVLARWGLPFSLGAMGLISLAASFALEE